MTLVSRASGPKCGSIIRPTPCPDPRRPPAPDWLHARATPLKFRFEVAMSGALALGADLNKWNDEDNALAAKMIALYKRIRPTVQNGKLYRLRSPDSDFSAVEYVAEDAHEPCCLHIFTHSASDGVFLLLSCRV